MGQRMQWDTQTSSRNVGGQEGGKIILESRKIITKGAGAFRASSARTVIPPCVTPWGHSPAQEHLPSQLLPFLNSAPATSPVPGWDLGLVRLSLNISSTWIWAVAAQGASWGFAVPWMSPFNIKGIKVLGAVTREEKQQFAIQQLH